MSSAKHLWIVSHYAQSPSDRGGLTRHHALATYLRHHGWHSTIIAASTEHPSGRQRPVQCEIDPADVDGVPFVWLRTPSYRGNGRDRIVNMLAFGWRAVASRAVRSLPAPDAVIGSSPHPAAGMAGAWLARRYDVPFYYEVRDLWPQALIDMGWISSDGLTARAMRMMESHLFRSARRSIGLWPNIGAYVEERGIEAPSPVWISNGVDLAALPEPSPPPAHKGLSLMYLGAHGGANGLDNVIRAMRIVQDKALAADISLRLIGDGPQKHALRTLAHELGVKTVRFEEPVEKRRVPEVAAQADGFVFNLIDAPMFRFGISPNKLYEYMAAQRPVIFCCEAFNNPVAECGGGITVRPGVPEDLADAIIELASFPAHTRAAMGEAGRRHIEAHYSYEALAAALADLLERSR